MPDVNTLKFVIPEQTRIMSQTNAELLQTHFPGLWRKLYSRIYGDVKGFVSARTVASNMGAPFLMLDYVKGRISSLDEGFICALCAAAANIRYDTPMYYVTRELAQDLLHTNAPDDIDWRNMPMPFEGMTFVLEEGALVHPATGALGTYMTVGRNLRGQLVDYPGNRWGQCPMLHDYMHMTCSVIGKAGTSFDFQHALRHEDCPIVRLEELEEVMLHEVPVYESSDGAVYDDVDKRFSSMYVRLLFNLLLVMEAEPELVERGRRSNQKRAKSGLGFWTPTFVGRNYRFARSAGAAAGGNGNGISPRGHWRRGHWTMQPHGPRNSLRKRMRIRSLFVLGGRHG